MPTKSPRQRRPRRAVRRRRTAAAIAAPGTRAAPAPRATAATPASRPALTNADIADRLRALAQLLSARKENPFKIKAYRRAADSIAHLGESIAELVAADADLTAFAGIGKGIAAALREIVGSGTLRKLDTLRAELPPEVAALTEHPRLDPRRVRQIYQKLGINSIPALREKLIAGDIGRRLGARMEHHVRTALLSTNEILLYDAHEIVGAVQRFLLKHGATRAEPAGAFRRRVEVVDEITFLIEADDFGAVVTALQRYGGGSEVVNAGKNAAVLKPPSGILLRVEAARPHSWGLALIKATGSESHWSQLPPAKLKQLAASRTVIADEPAAYDRLGLSYIPPELREGRDEIEQARRGTLPVLVTRQDIRGELHAHTTGSDGAHSIEQMAAAAAERGYEYLGITDHSQSLKIARGVAEADLWQQIRRIDRLNAKHHGVRLLKSAEVDILADGSLDYSDALLRELDYTVCSIHSRFALNQTQQTERVLRAMDHPCFTILGHATGRLLLRRPGYELDFERLIAHARARGCFFEINSSPDRLDLSADNARRVRVAGIPIAICTDAHSVRELDYIECGIEQARRAGLEKRDVLNCLPLAELLRAFRR